MKVPQLKLSLRPLILLVLTATLLACANPDLLESVPDAYRVYRGDGSSASLAELYRASRTADITFIGENHGDPVAHDLEEKILQETSGPDLALSLEMFETDVQLVVDEYLDGLIQEEHFMEDARAWSNYERGYRPLVEYAKTQDIPVLAANAPRRYVNLVSRKGPGALEQLPPEARSYLPPLPYAEASPEYREKFIKLMAEAMPEGSHAAQERVADDEAQSSLPLEMRFSLAAQSLWDATMAWSLAQYLQAHPQARLLHINGSFHTEGRMGILDHLEHYQPEAEALVVTIQPSDTFPSMDMEEMAGLGDFVIITDPSLQKPSATSN